MSRSIVGLSAFVLLGFGVAFLVAPERLFAALGQPLEAPDAITDIRAFYGGGQLCFAALLGRCALEPGRTRDGLWILFLLMSGLFAGRLVGVGTSGFEREITYVLGGAELLGAVVAGALIWRGREPG